MASALGSDAGEEVAAASFRTPTFFHTVLLDGGCLRFQASMQASKPPANPPSEPWQLGLPPSLPVRPFIHLAVGQNHWYHFGVGEFTTHLRFPFTGGEPIWVLKSSWPSSSARPWRVIRRSSQARCQWTWPRCKRHRHFFLSARLPLGFRSNRFGTELFGVVCL